MFMSISKSIQISKINEATLIFEAFSCYNLTLGLRGAVNLEKTGNFDARKPNRNKRKNQKFPVRDQDRDQIKAGKTGIF